jgi:hypothetical protein
LDIVVVVEHERFGPSTGKSPQDNRVPIRGHEFNSPPGSFQSSDDQTGHLGHAHSLSGDARLAAEGLESLDCRIQVLVNVAQDIVHGSPK